MKRIEVESKGVPCLFILPMFIGVAIAGWHLMLWIRDMMIDIGSYLNRPIREDNDEGEEGRET